MWIFEFWFLKKIEGNFFIKRFPKTRKQKVFETIKLDKILMPTIQLKHSSWDSCKKVYLN